MANLFGNHLHGVKVPHHKGTADSGTVTMPVPDKVVIPMSQHMGAPCIPLVKAKDTVKVGQKIGDCDAFMCVPVHASVSGTVTAVEDFTTTMGSITKAVVIEADHLQEVDDSVKPPVVNGLESFLTAVKESGLVGLGGAGFPTHIKLNPKNLAEVDTLIVNAAECEPYITADNRAILEDGADLFAGIAAVMKYLELRQAVIGIEDNKPEAIAYLQQHCPPNVSVKVLQSKYPQGGEKVLIYETVGKIVEEGKLPSDYGTIVMNVSSLAFLGKYLATGMPLVAKRLTVAGSAVKNPQNVWVPLGTPYQDVIAFCGGYVQQPEEVLMGGPMMGIDVYNDAFPVLKNNNAILAFTAEDVKTPPESPCIRCGKCVSACPFNLMPAAIDRAQRAGNVEKLAELKVNLCMECGCCAYVCPAKRQLVLSNRLAKKLLREQGKR